MQNWVIKSQYWYPLFCHFDTQVVQYLHLKLQVPAKKTIFDLFKHHPALQTTCEIEINF